jgi:DNA replication protein DnaC
VNEVAVRDVTAPPNAPSRWYGSAVLRPPTGIPFAYRDVSFTTRRLTPALRAAKAFVEDDEFTCTAMVLQGGVGVGKTTAAVAVARAYIEENLSERVAFYTFGDFVHRLLDGALRAETLDLAREADLVLIDDLGSSYASRDGFGVQMLEEVVIHREASYYPMFLTTNLEPAEFRRRFGDRIYDRLRGEWGRWMNVDGRSLRQKRRPS